MGLNLNFGIIFPASKKKKYRKIRTLLRNSRYFSQYFRVRPKITVVCSLTYPL